MREPGRHDQTGARAQQPDSCLVTDLDPPPARSGYYSPRNEITLGVSSRWDHYRFSAIARRDLASDKWVNYGASVAYEDECFVFDVRFTRRFTSVLGDNGATALLFFFTFKTVGQFGYRAI